MYCSYRASVRSVKSGFTSGRLVLPSARVRSNFFCGIRRTFWIGKLRFFGLLLLLAGLAQHCTVARKRSTTAEVNTTATAETTGLRPASVPGIESILAKPVLPREHDRFFDCMENSAAITALRPQYPEFDLFPKVGHTDREFYLTEESGWPFVIGFHGRSRMQPGQPVLVGLRGEASGFHKSSATPSFLRLHRDLPATTLVTVDEFRYVENKQKKRSLAPICHRSKYPDRYIHTESPGFENGGGTRLLWRLTAYENPVIIVSYSNATTPRNQMFERKILSGRSIDFRQISDHRKFLESYLLETGFAENAYPHIRGFIDMEGNYEVTKPFWDMLAYIRLEIWRDPEKFFYSAARIDKFDAYAGHLAMIKALNLEGVEDDEGVIRYMNKQQNVVLDLVTTPYPPHYVGNSGDIRKLTRMRESKAKKITRSRVNHYQMGDFTVDRVLRTTRFLESLRQPPLQTSLAHP